VQFVQGYVYSFAFTGLGTIVAGTNSGPYVSTNVGQTWSLQSRGMSQPFTLCLYIDHRGGLFAGTYGGGVFKADQVLAEVRTALPALPRATRLAQNFPNPFNPETHIAFETAEGAFVSLKVYDVLGREVANLVHDNRPAGSYDVRWDGGNSPSGLYFYRLQAGKFTETKKMLLLR
jgi:hypothetical protein